MSATPSESDHNRSPRPAAEVVLQEQVPPTQSLEWLLGQAYWSARGVEAFTSHEVPNLTNNDGMGASRAAEVLFQACEQAHKAGNALHETILVAETGIGLGLHARLLLDHFRAVCAARQRDYYDRVVYLAGDTSRTTLEQIRDRGILASHGARVRLGILDALRPDRFEDLTSGEIIPLQGILFAFICNYVLDVLPYEIVERVRNGWKRLEFRTVMVDLDHVAAVTHLTVDRVLDLARAPTAEHCRELLPVFPFLRLDQRHAEWQSQDIPFGAEFESYLRTVVTDFAREKLRPDQECLHVHNHGAMRALDRALDVLDPHGFVLLNDYGAVSLEQASMSWRHQRFGGSTAMGLNLPWLEHWLCALRSVRGWMSRPSGDDEYLLHARLITPSQSAALHDVFRNVFDREVLVRVSALMDEAEQHSVAEKGELARESLVAALALAPDNWVILSQLARCALRFFTPRSAIYYLEQALEINPVTSADLWNDLGDARYNLGDPEGALEAYHRAADVNPEDPRTEYNFAWVFHDRRQYAEALCACGRAFALDHTGRWSERILKKQAEILERRVEIESVLRTRRQSV